MRGTVWLVVAALASTGLAFRGCGPDDAAVTRDGAVEESAAAADVEGTGPAAAGRTPLNGPWWRDTAVVAEVVLSDEQLAEVEQLMAGGSDDRSTIRRRERRAGLAFLRALSQDPYDPAHVEHRAAEVVDALSDVHRHRLDQIHALRDILTHEQWLRLWKAAPQTLQVTRFLATLGPTISVTDEWPPDPGDGAPGDSVGDD